MATTELLGISKEEAEAIRQISMDMFEIDARMNDPRRLKNKLVKLQSEYEQVEYKLSRALKLLSEHGLTANDLEDRTDISYEE